MRLARFSILLALLAACARPQGDAPDDGGAPAPAASRDDAGARLPSGGAARGGQSTALPAGSADPEALMEILAAARTALPSPSGQPVASRLGTDTGVPRPAERPAADQAPADAPKPRVEIGTPKLQGEMSTPAIEKAARAQLYWDLVQRCRAPDGKILPPDAIKVEFNLDADGYIVASTILASATERQYEAAAVCIWRELSRATFRAPAGARGLPTRVTATVPSVD